MRLRAESGLAIVLAATWLASACSSPATFAVGEGPAVRERMAPIDQVTIADDPGTIRVAFTGGTAGDIMADTCHTDYKLEVNEGTSPPTVIVWELRPSVPPQQTGGVQRVCLAIGLAWELEHRWWASAAHWRCGLARVRTVDSSVVNRANVCGQGTTGPRE